MQRYSLSVQDDDYESFIHNLRQAIAQKLQGLDPNLDIRVLPLSQDSPEYFIVILTTNGKGIQVLMLLESLYLLAIRANVDTMPWIILDDEQSDATYNFLNLERNMVWSGDQKQVPRKSSIPASYTKLEGYKKRENIKLGKRELLEAIECLAKVDETVVLNKECASSMIVVIECICEALRFKTILNFIVLHYYNGKAPDDIHIDMENAWNKLSRFVINMAKKEPNNPKVKFSRTQKEVTEEEALAFVALLKGMKPQETEIRRRYGIEVESTSRNEQGSGSGSRSRSRKGNKIERSASTKLRGKVKAKCVIM